MTYSAPVGEMLFAMEELCNLDAVSKLPGYEESTPDTVRMILDEAGRFASEVLSPINGKGDDQGASWKSGKVTTPDDWPAAYTNLIQNGWNCPSADIEYGGMGLPMLVNACIQEMFHGANMAFQLCPMLTQGAVEALSEYACEGIKRVYLPKLVSGEWAGTMNITESQAGSDLAAIRTTATPNEDHYLIRGQKIFITYGDHDLAENIIHLVLARLPDAPTGVKGLSLFLVPKYTVDAEGSICDRNDITCVSIEHKLGIHASPTCTISFGDQDGAIGYLIGEENYGLQHMFAMMNNARLSVGIQAIGVGEHAFQDAVAYAIERRQGGGRQIIEHADVKRMLGEMRARTDAVRILALRAAAALDFAHRSEDPDIRARFQRRVDLLIPVVKGYSSEQAIGITSMGLQVHGGMGYIEETGVAQHFRDARITTIYEGTTGIQALDLIDRKLLVDQGLGFAELIEDMKKTLEQIVPSQDYGVDPTVLAGSLAEAIDTLESITAWHLENQQTNQQLCRAGASKTLDAFGLCLGAWALVDSAIGSAKCLVSATKKGSHISRIKTAEFFCKQIFPQSGAVLRAILSGAEETSRLSLSDFKRHRS